MYYLVVHTQSPIGMMLKNDNNETEILSVSPEYEPEKFRTIEEARVRCGNRNTLMIVSGKRIWRRNKDGKNYWRIKAIKGGR